MRNTNDMNSSEIEIVIRMLTPLWTGGVKNITDRLYETGIIGSLRWWYEAIVRALGGDACDPTKHKCGFKRDKYEKYDCATVYENDRRKALHVAGLCDVCRIFGATGWKRRFNLEILQDNTRSAWSDNDITLNIRPPKRTTGWHLPAGRTGDFRLKIHGDPDAIGMLANLFLFLEKYGAIGAKSQLGYGFFEITNRDEVQNKAKLFVEYDSSQGKKYQSVLPDLNQFSFFKFRFKPSHADWWTRVGGLQRLLGGRKTAGILSQLAKQDMVPVSPVLKNQWRFEEWHAPFSAKRWLLGVSRDKDRLKSKVSVSWAYRTGNIWSVKGWAWMPEDEPTKRGVLRHHKNIDAFEGLLKDGSIWKKALNLDNECQTDLTVNSQEVTKLLRGET